LGGGDARSSNSGVDFSICRQAAAAAVPALILFIGEIGCGCSCFGIRIAIQIGDDALYHFGDLPTCHGLERQSKTNNTGSSTTEN
jgi:hypothetical protein